jgi:hypothetical protein
MPINYLTTKFWDTDAEEVSSGSSIEKQARFLLRHDIPE